MSNDASELEAIVVADAIADPARFIVNVCEDPDVFVTIIFVTTVVVLDGTVYRVVLPVLAAPLNNFLGVLAIYTAPIIFKISKSEEFDETNEST